MHFDSDHALKFLRFRHALRGYASTDIAWIMAQWDRAKTPQETGLLLSEALRCQGLKHSNLRRDFGSPPPQAPKRCEFCGEPSDGSHISVTGARVRRDAEYHRLCGTLTTAQINGIQLAQVRGQALKPRGMVNSRQAWMHSVWMDWADA